MWSSKSMILLTVSLCLALNLFTFLFTSAQIVKVGSNSSRTSPSTTYSPNSDMTTGSSSNTSGIMQNTSGMLDDVFEAIKDSVGSFFGK